MKISWVNVYYDKLGIVLANSYVTSFISSTLFRTLESWRFHYYETWHADLIMLRGIWQEICFWTFWLFPLSLSPFLSSHYFSVRPWGCVQALCPSLEWDTHHGVWTLISRSSPWPHLCLSLPPFPVNICFLLNPHSRDRGNPGAFFWSRMPSDSVLLATSHMVNYK